MKRVWVMFGLLSVAALAVIVAVRAVGVESGRGLDEMPEEAESTDLTTFLQSWADAAPVVPMHQRPISNAEVIQLFEEHEDWYAQLDQGWDLVSSDPWQHPLRNPLAFEAIFMRRAVEGHLLEGDLDGAKSIVRRIFALLPMAQLQEDPIPLHFHAFWAATQVAVALEDRPEEVRAWQRELHAFGPNLTMAEALREAVDYEELALSEPTLGAGAREEIDEFRRDALEAAA